VLHAVGDHVHLRLRSSSTQAWTLEVEDHFPGLPVVRDDDGLRAEGKGLRLLDELTSGWGVTPTPTGKIVWAEFLKPRVAAAEGNDPPALDPRDTLRAEGQRFRNLAQAGPAEESRDVRLLGLPLALFAAQLARHRALMRELRLVRREDGDRDRDRELLRLAQELEAYQGMGESTEGQRAAALARGQSAIDITYSLPADAGPACQRMMELLRDADHLAAQGALLALPSEPDEVAVREWFLCEISRQCAGEAPTPWARWLRQ
jgi:hypothetical protein